MVAVAPLQPPQPPRATAADLERLPPDRRAEVIDGEIVEKAQPGGSHANAQGTMIGRLHGPFHRRPGGSSPGGWWILPDVDVELEPHEVYRPDVAGWRRERSPDCPRGMPLTLRPDWVSEILSPSNARNDLVKKLRVYHRCEIPHYWIVDPESQTLTVYRWTKDGYLAVLAAEAGERVRAEPFDAIELPVGALFGSDEE